MHAVHLRVWMQYLVVYHINILCALLYEINYAISSNILNKGSYMSASVLLNLLSKLRKRDKIRGLPRILSLFSNEVNK